MFERKAPGPDANLPPFIYDRMKAMNLQPTASQLALLTGVNLVTLQRNLKGEREMKLSTAYALKEGLKLDNIDELIANVPGLITQ